MADQKTTEALDAVKSLARQFGAFAVLDTTCDRLVSLLGRESDLAAHVAQLTSQRDGLLQSVGTAKSELAQLLDAATAAKRAKQDADAASEAAQVKQVQAESSLAALSQADTEARDAARNELRGLIEKANATRAAQKKIEDDHTLRLAGLQAEELRISEQTHQLQTQLDELKTRITPLLA